MYYTPERRIRLGRTLVGFVGAAIGVIVGAFVYAKLQPQLLSSFLRVGEVIVGAIAVGLLGIVPVRYGKVRLPLLAAFIGAALALIAVYGMWITWVHDALHARVGYWTLISRPTFLYELVRLINRVGIWNYHGERVRGFGLLVFWLLEFAAMLLAGVFIPMKAIAADDPECKHCGAACKLVRPIARFAADRQADLVAAVEGHEFGAVLSLPAPANDREPQLSLRLVSCPRCGQTNVVTVNQITWATGANGQPKLQIKPIVNQLIVPPVEAQQLKTIIKQVVERREAPEAEAIVSVEPMHDAASMEPSPGDEDNDATVG